MIRRVRIAFALLLLLSGALAPLAAETISARAYRQRLTAIQSRLLSGDWVGAGQRSRQLLQDRIALGTETIEPDASVLGPLARARNPRDARAVAPALSHLMAALPAERVEDRPATKPDGKLLAEVRRKEALAALPEGGALPEVKDGGIAAALTEFLRPMAEAIGNLWDRFLEWLWELLFGRSGSPGSALGLDMRMVTALVVALALLTVWILFRSVRNRQRGAAAVAEGPAPLPPAADDDPLSREASEWERYARELAAAGRAREAIRAWYHAVLVALYRAGSLHYRKGRTNWEYVSAVPPGTTWRSRFVELTRHFEREWYGRDQSAPEALRAAEEMALGLLSSARERAA